MDFIAAFTQLYPWRCTSGAGVSGRERNGCFCLWLVCSWWLSSATWVTVLYLCICRQIMTILWVSISVSSWSILARRGCAPMTCLGWPFTTLAKAPVLLWWAGTSHYWRAPCDDKRRGKTSGWREERTIYPPSPPKQKQRVLDVKTVNLIQVGFRQPHPIQLQHIFACQLTSQVPMSAPSWVCMMLRAPPTPPHPTQTRPQTTVRRRLRNSFVLRPF